MARVAFQRGLDLRDKVLLSLILCSSAAPFRIVAGDVGCGNRRGLLGLGLLQRVEGPGPQDRIIIWPKAVFGAISVSD